VFCGALQHTLWCASAWFVVRISYVDVLNGKRNFRRRRRLFPCTFFYHCKSAESCVDVVIKLFPVTSSSLSVVFWGLFEFSCKFWVLFAVCLRHRSRIASSTLALRAGFCFRSSPSRVFVDYYFLVEQG